MDRDPLEHLIAIAEVELSAFAICEIGEDWRLSVAPLESIICHFIMQGSGFLEFGDRRVPISPGSIIIVPPNTHKSISGSVPVIHEVVATESCSNRGDGLVLFKARGETTSLFIGCAAMTAACGGSHGLLDRLPEPVVLTGRRAWPAASVETLLQELTRPDVGSRVIVECLMKQALVLLLREHLEQGAASPLVAPFGDPRLLRAVSAMLKQPGQRHSIESLAETAGMSRSSFMASFAQQHGRTPREFLQSVRMHSAARLLATSAMPVKRLAAAVGYASRSQFSRTFKQTFGADPTTYRLKRTREQQTLNSEQPAITSAH